MVNFLEEYDRLSTLRGSGLDYYNPLTIQPENVPGVEMRVSRLLGFNHYRRQPLSGMPYKVTETQKVIVEINGVPTEVQAYGWQILKENQVILESLNRSFTRRADAYEELGLASLLAAEEQNYATTPAATPVATHWRPAPTTPVAPAGITPTAQRAPPGSPGASPAKESAPSCQ